MQIDQFSDSSFYWEFCHFILQIREESCQVFLMEEAEETKDDVPGNVPLIKEELLLER